MSDIRNSLPGDNRQSRDRYRENFDRVFSKPVKETIFFGGETYTVSARTLPARGCKDNKPKD